MRITVEELEAQGACSDQLRIFAKEWPDGVKVTLKNLTRAAKLNLDLDWFAGEFLPPLAVETYDKAIVPILEAHSKAIEPALEVYKRDTTPSARARYYMATALAQETYDKATAAALYKVITEL